MESLSSETFDIAAVFIGIMVGFLIGFLFSRAQSFERFRKNRKQILQGSRNSILGEVYEKVLPALPSFPYAPKDMVFIGKGCDYIIFDGLTSGQLKEVVFLELKSGKSRLTGNEQAIKNALAHKKVRFCEYRIDGIKNN